MNAARSTFVGDNGRLLRGPFTSTEWTGPVPASQIANMKNLGFNAVHLYAESFDPSYPTNGSTAPSARPGSLAGGVFDVRLMRIPTTAN